MTRPSGGLLLGGTSEQPTTTDTSPAPPAEVVLSERDMAIRQEAERRLEGQLPSSLAWRLGELLGQHPMPGRTAAKREAAIRRLLPEINSEFKLKETLEELYYLSTTKRHIVTVLNSKGGSGKTPLAVYLAICLYQAVREQILLVDVNENDGTTAQRAGVDRTRTATIRHALAHPELFMSYDSIAEQLLKPPKYGVRVMSSDPGGTDDIAKEPFKNMLLRLKYHGGHSMFCDSGNGNAKPANMAATEVADTLLFTVLADNPDTFEQALSTMHAYKQLGQGNKVRRGFVVVSATRPDDTREKFLETLRDTARKIRVRDETHGSHELSIEEFNIQPERIFLIPHSDYIKERQVADHKKIGQEVFVAYLELLLAIFRQDVSYQSFDPDKVVRYTDATTNGASAQPPSLASTGF